MTISRTIAYQMREGSWIRRMFEPGIVLKREHGERNVVDLSLNCVEDWTLDGAVQGFRAAAKELGLRR